jgi:hypothetical protein
VNPQWHDEFVTLCALFPSGELTEEEWALLQVHLAYCDSCRVAFEEYQQIASNVIPAMASAAALEPAPPGEKSPFSFDAAEKTLMSRLNSMTTSRAADPVRKSSWPVVGTIAASLAVTAGLLTIHLYRSQAPLVTPSAAVQLAEGNPQPNAASGLDSELRSKLEVADHKVTELEQQLTAAEDRSRQSTATATNAEQQLETEKSERKKISDERDALREQLVVAQTEAQSLRDKSTAGSVAASQQNTRLVALETKLHDVSAALDEKDKMLALDKEFLAHDREIRDLIGARDLYIADIYDVAQNGKTSKPFGRIFYTKDKSLVFYGYDLDKQAGLKQSVAFQAWGSGDDKQNVSLGLFYQDETNKRWVLRFNDTKTLARLNMVFVTAEPQGGSAKPTGKPLLLAYLQVQPNHP